MRLKAGPTKQSDEATKQRRKDGLKEGKDKGRALRTYISMMFKGVGKVSKSKGKGRGLKDKRTSEFEGVGKVSKGRSSTTGPTSSRSCED